MIDIIKGSLRSKTMWFNGAVTLLGVMDMLMQNAPIISAAFPGAGPLLAVVGAIGTILRVVTDKSLSEKA